MYSKNLFFSYYFVDGDHYDRLIKILEDRGYFDFKTAHVAESDAQSDEYVKSLLRPKIDWSGTVVVIIGPGTYTRKWVNWEADYAAGQGKRIVGVYEWGKQDSRLPRAVKDHADEIVGWDADAIVAAIRG